MRLLKTSSIYPHYLETFYGNRPLLHELPYEEQYAALMNDCAFYADFWKRNLEAKGDWEVQEIVVNAEHLQRRWAIEHDLGDQGPHWKESILEQQIYLARPDVWFCHSAEISPDYRKYIRSRTPSLKYIFGYDGVGRNDSDAFSGCDAVVCLLPESLRYYSQAGFTAIPRKLGFEPRVLSFLKATSDAHPISFIGGVNLGTKGHLDRLKLLIEVHRSLPTSLYIPRLPEGLQFLRALASTGRRSLRDAASIAKAWRSIPELNRSSQGALYGISMFQTLKDSLVSLNCHIDISGPTAANFRMFEATGVGTCLLTDWKSNIGELFIPETEVVTYRSHGECLDRARYLIENPAVAKDIGRRGQERTLRNHTLAQSIEPVMNSIRELLSH